MNMNDASSSDERCGSRLLQLQPSRVGGRPSTPGQCGDDVKKGLEPGANGTAKEMLVASDSFEDLTQCAAHSPTSDACQCSYCSVEKGQRLTSSPNDLSTLEASMDGVFIDISDDVNATSDASSSKVQEVGTNNVELSRQMSEKERSPTHSQHLEEVESRIWKAHKKHVFILSEAGKPIYSRYGSEDRLVTLMGVMQALVSFVQNQQDNIRSIISGRHKFVFLVRQPLLLVGVSCADDSTSQLVLQLTYVYNQIVSVLTTSQLDGLFKQRRNYDLRKRLTGAERFLDNMLNMMDTDPSYLLGAVRCLPLAASVRDMIGQVIVHNTKVKDLVFAVLVAKNQLITLVRLKQYQIHPADLHLIFNLVAANTSFQAAENWTPVCLPKFNASGFLHAHVSYLDDDCSTCLLLLSTNRDPNMFEQLSDCKQKILEKLTRQHCLHAIKESLASERYKISQVGIPDLRHFMYKSRSTAQYTSPELEAPYLEVVERERLFGQYHVLHDRMHSRARPLQIMFHMGPNETLLGWVKSGFELYAAFGPLVTKQAAAGAVTKLFQWIKKEEDRLFILNSPTF